MIVWLILNTAARLVIMVIAAYKLTAMRATFNCPERIGLGLAGGAGFLTIPQIWSLNQSPFEGWASAIFSLGLAVYLVGRLSRHWPGAPQMTEHHNQCSKIS